MERHTVFLGNKFNSMSMSILPKLTYKFDTIPFQKLPIRILLEFDSLILKNTWKTNKQE